MTVKNNSFLIKLLSFFLLIIFWLVVSSILNIETLPSPLEVYFKLQKDLSNGSLLYHLSITLYRVLVSFLLAMFIGIAIIAVGFLLMSGGGSDDPNVFNDEIYNFRRIRLAPSLVIIGFVVEVYAILTKPE